jgi:predicted hydrocarbon binding protein
MSDLEQARVRALQLSDDAVILLETLEGVVGNARHGILFNFGEKSGRSFYRDVHIKGTDPHAKLNDVLKILSQTGWLSGACVSRKKGDLILEVADGFEQRLEMKQCDFMRGFLSGLVSSIYDEYYYCEEESVGNGKTVFRLRKLII